MMPFPDSMSGHGLCANDPSLQVQLPHILRNHHLGMKSSLPTYLASTYVGISSIAQYAFVDSVLSARIASDEHSCIDDLLLGIASRPVRPAACVAGRHHKCRMGQEYFGTWIDYIINSVDTDYK